MLAQVDPRPFAIALHQAEATHARDEAQLAGAKRNLERFEGVGAQRLIPQQQVDDQRALVDQLTGTVAADQAQIENARLQLDYARITSPIDGVTGVRLVDPGNLVQHDRRERDRRRDADGSDRGAVHAAAGRAARRRRASRRRAR